MKEGILSNKFKSGRQHYSYD